MLLGEASTSSGLQSFTCTMISTPFNSTKPCPGHGSQRLMFGGPAPGVDHTAGTQPIPPIFFCGDVVIDLWRSYNLIYNYALPTDRSRRSLLMFTHPTKHNASITVPGVRKWKAWAWAMSPTPMNTQTPTEHKRSKPSNVCPLRPNMLPIYPHADMATLFSVIRIGGKRLLIPQYTYAYVQTW